jgi:hypothetical protein
MYKELSKSYHEYPVYRVWFARNVYVLAECIVVGGGNIRFKQAGWHLFKVHILARRTTRL